MTRGDTRLQVIKTESTTISLVDLAGSEKFGKEGKRVGAFINGDLLALGKVLTALKEGSVTRLFV